MAENSDPKPKRRGPGRPFQKGQSGNPGGVPKDVLEVKAIMAHRGQELVDLLIESAKAGNVPAQIRCVEYVLGKPKDVLEMTGKDGAQLEIVVRLEKPE